MHQPIVEALFKTRAIRVCPADQPFWYTSGLFGPYYVNTHFLYGSESEAVGLLQAIETASISPMTFPSVIGRRAEQQYQNNAIYRSVIDRAAAVISGRSFDLISGGERRDFFFSLQVAKVLGKPHLCIFKDGTSVYAAASGAAMPPAEAGLSGRRALHVADLVTQASSYTRAWIPALNDLGLELKETLAIVDRNQDGAAVLASEGVKLHSLAVVSDDLFRTALAGGLIDSAQMALIEAYMADPIRFVRDFLASHPNYLDEQLARGGKEKERAERLLQSDYI